MIGLFWRRQKEKRGEKASLPDIRDRIGVTLSDKQTPQLHTQCRWKASIINLISFAINEESNRPFKCTSLFKTWGHDFFFILFFYANLTNQSLIDQHFKNAQQKQAHVTFWVRTICASFSCLFHTALVADVFTLPFQIWCMLMIYAFTPIVQRYTNVAP